MTPSLDFHVTIPPPAHTRSTPNSGWIHPKDLSSLRPHEIDSYLADETKKRNGDLHEGYSIARDPSPWLLSNKAKREEAKALLESMDGSDEDAAEDDEDADADADGEGEVDELASEPGGEDASGKSKKRKRMPSAGEEDAPKKKKAAKAAKEPKTPKPKKEKATTPTATGKKPRASKAKSKAVVESEDDAGGDADADGDGDDTAGMEIDDDARASAKKGRKSIGGAKEKKEKAVKEPKEKKEPKVTLSKVDKKDAAGKKDKAGTSAAKDDDDGDDCKLLFDFSIFLIVAPILPWDVYLDFFSPPFFAILLACQANITYHTAKGSSDPQSLKVRDWRHKLQKTFLSQKAMPKPEVRSCSSLLFFVVPLSTRLNVPRRCYEEKLLRDLYEPRALRVRYELPSPPSENSHFSFIVHIHVSGR